MAEVKSDFSLGAVVLPATDSLLAELGYDVKSLGPLAMGIVIEEGSRRSQVHFPEIKVTLWLDHTELRDLADEMKINSQFKAVEKYFQASEESMLLPVLLNKVIHIMQATHVLGVDHGPMDEVWEEASAKLKEYYEGPTSVDVCRLSLGLEEMNPKRLDELSTRLGKRLLLTRFLPSGMYKFEISLYLRRNL